jgi:tetratricopeptide (TPR) repeat protein
MKYHHIRIITFLLILSFLASCNNSPKTDPESENRDDTVITAQEPEVTAPKTHLSAQTTDDESSVSLNLTDMGSTPEAKQEISVLFSKGTDAYASEDFATGVEYFEQIVSEQPDNRKAYYNLGVGYTKLQRFSEALKSFSKAIEIIPNDAISIQYRGRVYYMMGNYEKALEDYTRVLDLKDTDPVSWYNRGTAYGAMKLYRKAKEDFDKAITLDPEYALAFFNRGLANYYLGMRHEACVDWRKAHSLGHYESEKALTAYCEDND